MSHDTLVGVCVLEFVAFTSLPLRPSLAARVRGTVECLTLRWLPAGPPHDRQAVVTVARTWQLVVCETVDCATRRYTAT
jgi:hypothetical protein